jgi:hypothetical protein
MKPHPAPPENYRQQEKPSERTGLSWTQMRGIHAYRVICLGTFPGLIPNFTLIHDVKFSVVSGILKGVYEIHILFE